MPGLQEDDVDERVDDDDIRRTKMATTKDQNK